MSHDRLTCIVNEEHADASYLDALMCMVPFSPLLCDKLWGSRSLVVEVQGSAEFLKLTHAPLPSHANELISLNATRWLHLSSPSADTTGRNRSAREIVQVPVEPLYLCARSNAWSGANATLSLTTRGSFQRERDRRRCFERIVYHFLLLCALSSLWLLPYIGAVTVGGFCYLHGLQKIMMLSAGAIAVLCLTPLMLTKRHRHHAKLYLHYFFTRAQADEAKQMIRQRMPLFQALFFSSVLLCCGCTASYMVYHYFGIDRDVRNVLLKLTIGASLSWLAFFICRSFERFFSEWSWVIVSVGLAKTMEDHLNPLARDKVVVALLLLSLGMVLLIRRMARTSAVQTILAALEFQWSVLRGYVGLRRVRSVPSHHHHPAQQHKTTAVSR